MIVGAGPGGLAAAMMLQQMGCQVTILERLDRVGGRTGAITEDGYTFDIGPTFFLYPRVLEDVFKFCDRDLWAEVPMKQVDPMYQVAFEDGGSLFARAGLEAMKAEIAKLAPKDAENLARYMDDNRRKLEKFRPVLESPFESLLDYLRPDVLASLSLLKPHEGLDKDLRRYFADHRVRKAFSFQAKYLGMSPFNCPSLFTILGFLEHEYGVWHPIGGCNAIMNRMAEIAQEMGVDLRLSEPVENIEFEGNRPIAAVTGNGRYPADAMVVNADFGQAMTRLVPEKLRRRWNDQKIDAQVYSCSTFMLYLGIEGRLDNHPHHTICLADDFAGNIDQIQDSKVLPKSPSFYVQNASINDSTLAPEGHSTLYILVPVPHQTPNVDWAKEKAAFRETTLDRLSLIGIPDIRSRIRYEKVVTPDDWANDMNIYKGATFNLSHTLGQMLYFRPHNRFEDLEGVYLVGGGTHPGSGLPVIFESARISSKLLAQDLGL